jgi:hypothetical protein
MPEQVLLGVIATEIIDRFEQIAEAELTLEECVGFRTAGLANYFGVSNNAMENRVRNIDLGQVMQGPYISPADKARFESMAESVSKSREGLWAVQFKRA